MSDDTAKGRKSIVEAVGAYAELYPSFGPRLLAAETSARPEIRKRLAALQKAIEAREGQRRDRLVQNFGLTQTEARLAVHLAEGGSVAGYAEIFGVSVGTVRSQLKSIFAKTGVNRQGALGALVGR